MSNYNPYISALKTAAAELTSDEAKAYYSLRAQQDIQTAFVLIVQLGCFAYALGQQCRGWLDSLEQSAAVELECSAIVPTMSAAVVAPSVPVSVVAIASITPAALTAFTPFGLLTPGVAKLKRKTTARKTPAKVAPRKRGAIS